MKRLAFVLSVLFLCCSSAAVLAESPKVENQAKGKVYHAVVEGMTWKVGCSKRVREALTSNEKVAEVDVNLETKIVTIKTKTPKDALTKDEVVQALSKHPNYSVSSFDEQSGTS